MIRINLIKLLGGLAGVSGIMVIVYLTEQVFLEKGLTEVNRRLITDNLNI